MEYEKRIEELSAAIDASPKAPELYIERGKLFYSANEFGRALNDFLKALELDPEAEQARQFIKMTNEILAFRHKDLYNP